MLVILSWTRGEDLGMSIVQRVLVLNPSNLFFHQMMMMKMVMVIMIMTCMYKRVLSPLM